MKTLRAYAADGRTLVRNVELANTFFTRLKGLMFRESLPNDTGLLIYPCCQIHTYFMKFSIDVVYLNRDFKVVFIDRNIQPGVSVRRIREAKCVLELNAGEADRLGIAVDDVLTFA
ncbi:MAG TPA: DUF192 domain-containing protein [Clostridiales bacterium]|nr:DUF192 domain-containing protein [Clostridiales bacterium]HOJ35266.1 DUF192 domain-containing protein [Clostridiales bacterium]HOL78664.1 DUF192 domain-containing protein [Clostridiales bacterium]HPP67534.1 DUF192 domain-containing protein [Clostridiales bacterium]HQA05154.1 DUF192 domain-containing protein [Clostridiales bacterium]